VVPGGLGGTLPEPGRMSGVDWTGGALVASAMLAAALLASRLVPRLPEPGDGAGKLRYADLADRRFVVGCTGLAGLAATLAWIVQPPATQPLWWVLGTVGLVLAAVDARTTWLPLSLTRLAWAALAGAGLVALLLGLGLPVLLRAAAGAAVAGLLYLAVWRLSGGGFGFGDVRFAPLVGAATAADGWTTLLLGLFAGSVLGAAYGVVRRARGRTDPFPYAPALLTGAYLGVALAALG
jgi:leader peptidase (prepilin peptidase)/N-methyltransferase